ncbi:hypothetical protein p7 [Esparto virus]|uniref:Uncharacterized protein n=1 Tax=Esparto virus TaxID=2072209 RepID=A0A2I7G300_9VIRU|nr:hypothetical protein p7 [Esparto virus]AUQ43996.1 hypothetical protein p7 [Esparto virus]
MSFCLSSDSLSSMDDIDESTPVVAGTTHMIDKCVDIAYDEDDDDDLPDKVIVNQENGNDSDGNNNDDDDAAADDDDDDDENIANVNIKTDTSSDEGKNTETFIIHSDDEDSSYNEFDQNYINEIKHNTEDLDNTDDSDDDSNSFEHYNSMKSFETNAIVGNTTFQRTAIVKSYQNPIQTTEALSIFYIDSDSDDTDVDDENNEHEHYTDNDNSYRYDDDTNSDTDDEHVHNKENNEIQNNNTQTIHYARIETNNLDNFDTTTTPLATVTPSTTMNNSRIDHTYTKFDDVSSTNTNRNK